MTSRSRLFLLLPCILLTGAGCLSPVTVPKTAEQLDNRVTASTPVEHYNGFGALPSIPNPTRHPHVTLNAALPEIPTTVTVIRLRNGNPNETELRNIANAIGIPAGSIGDHPTDSALDISWSDDQGYRWTYKADERVLDFTRIKPPKTQLTLSVLPSNEELLNISNSFLLQRAFDPDSYRNALVDPDWNNWWLRAKAAGQCMNIGSLTTIRAIGSSDPFVASGPPSLPVAASTTCVSPEFPSRAVIRYRAFVDQRDVLRDDGSYVNGIEVIVDAASKQVEGGRITLFTDAEHSDYPALTLPQATSYLQDGGISSLTGDVSISTIVFGSYRLEQDENGVRTIYLIPALIGSGTHALPDGSTEPVRIVAPLLKP